MLGSHALTRPARGVTGCPCSCLTTSATTGAPCARGTMRTSTEPGGESGGSIAPLDASWRAERERIQEQALPQGAVVVTCPAAYGAGGLAPAPRRDARSSRPPRSARGLRMRLHAGERSRADGPRSRPALTRLVKPAMRISPALKYRRTSAEFDRYAAARLPQGEHLIAFNGRRCHRCGPHAAAVSSRCR